MRTERKQIQKKCSRKRAGTHSGLNQIEPSIFAVCNFIFMLRLKI